MLLLLALPLWPLSLLAQEEYDDEEGAEGEEEYEDAEEEETEEAGTAADGDSGEDEAAQPRDEEVEAGGEAASHRAGRTKASAGGDDEEEDDGEALAPAASLPAKAADLRGAVEVDIPPPAPFYPEDEPGLEDKLLVERLLGVHLVHPPWRHASERVDFTGNEVRVSYWYSIGAEPEAVACDALRWLSTGRNQWAGGAAELFEEMSAVTRLTLAFVNVQRRQKGQVPGSSDSYRYLLATISPDRVGEISPSSVEEPLASGKCLAFMKEKLDSFTFDSAYYEKELLRGLEGK